MTASRRPKPAQALDSILAATDYADALARMESILARCWSAAAMAGFGDGVSDATDDEPKNTPNPYRRP